MFTTHKLVEVNSLKQPTFDARIVGTWALHGSKIYGAARSTSSLAHWPTLFSMPGLYVLLKSLAWPVPVHKHLKLFVKSGAAAQTKQWERERKLSGRPGLCKETLEMYQSSVSNSRTSWFSGNWLRSEPTSFRCQSSAACRHVDVMNHNRFIGKVDC